MVMMHTTLDFRSMLIRSDSQPSSVLITMYMFHRNHLSCSIISSYSAIALANAVQDSLSR